MNCAHSILNTIVSRTHLITIIINLSNHILDGMVTQYLYLLKAFSVLFFFMLFVLGIGSNIAMCTCIITVLRDKFPALKAWQASIGLAMVGFSFGLIYVTPVSLNDFTIYNRTKVGSINCL